ncbi:MAG TPA: ATP-dependent helicase C-terminal domain-containing protein, partial [Planctomycetia bacterium]|nr:ATP-dependent helicase C-terminal domain-containing protein [Planctomycetia bacterium]
VTGVIDAGLARVMRYEPAVGLDRLTLSRISKASANQRAGRAGRTAPGICLRLWAEKDHHRRAEAEEPEVRRVDLAGPALELLCRGESDLTRFDWFEAPGSAAIDRALELLSELGAIGRDRRPTELGRRMLGLPVHPRLARLLMEGVRRGAGEAAALAAALLSERSPFTGSLRRSPAEHVSASDIADRVRRLEEFARGTGRNSFDLDPGAAHSVLRIARDLSRDLRSERTDDGSEDSTNAQYGLLRALFAAYPDRLCRRRAPGSDRGVMVGGRGVKLDAGSAVKEEELFLAVDVAPDRPDDRVRLASAVKREWLPPQDIVTFESTTFDPQTRRVTATRQSRFRDLVLEEVPISHVSAEQAATALAEAARSNLKDCLPSDDSQFAEFRSRVLSLQAWMPELELPSCQDDSLRDLLPELAAGRKSFEELQRAPWLDYLKARFTHSQLQSVDREAPEKFEVPSGSRIALRYEPGRPPVLAVRIQELFGLPQTPRVAGGRVPVLLHLLAPNYRPQQVTDDLTSFWNGAYQQVRKELRARYPRHAWPEDPWNAPPERRPPRRR